MEEKPTGSTIKIYINYIYQFVCKYKNIGKGVLWLTMRVPTPLLQCACYGTVIIGWYFFFYGNGFKYKCQKFLKHIIMKTCPECKILLWQSLEQFSHLENPDLGTIYQTNSGSEVTRPSLWPVEMNTQR